MSLVTRVGQTPALLLMLMLMLLLMLLLPHRPRGGPPRLPTSGATKRIRRAPASVRVILNRAPSFSPLPAFSQPQASRRNSPPVLLSLPRGALPPPPHPPPTRRIPKRTAAFVLVIVL